VPRLSSFVLLCGLFVDTACSGGTSPAVLPQGPIAGASTWQLVSPNGGTINTADDVTITVPAGALTEPTFIGVTRSVWPSYSPMSIDIAKGGGVSEYQIIVIGRAYDLDAGGTAFAQPITITIPFDSPPPGWSTANVVVVGSADGPLPSTLVDQTHVSGQTSKASRVFPGVITGFSMTCATAADCASGQRCDNGTNLCTGD